jgi:hypothetical protein
MNALLRPSRPFREARLSSDEGRLSDWYATLDDRGRQQWYTLLEIKAAVGISMSRLRVVLFRLRWDTQRVRGTSLTLYRGPSLLLAEDAKASYARLDMDIAAILVQLKTES